MHAPLRKFFEMNLHWDAIWCILRHTDLVESGWFFRYSYLYTVMIIFWGEGELGILRGGNFYPSTTLDRTLTSFSFKSILDWTTETIVNTCVTFSNVDSRITKSHNGSWFLRCRSKRCHAANLIGKKLNALKSDTNNCLYQLFFVLRQRPFVQGRKECISHALSPLIQLQKYKQITSACYMYLYSLTFSNRTE